MSFSFEMVLQIVIQAVSITAVVVTVKCNQRFFDEKLTNLEKKQDKHNCLIERMVRVEQSCKSAHHRIDETKNTLEGLHEGNSVKRSSHYSGSGED